MVRQQAFQLMQTAAIQTEILYAFIIIACSLMIYFGTKELYELSQYKSIKYFRNAFLYFALAYFSRTIIKVILIHFKVARVLEFSPRIWGPITLFIFVFFSTMAIFSLLHSIIYKHFKDSKIQSIIFPVFSAVLALLTILTHDRRIYLAINMLLLVIILATIYKARKENQKKTNTLYITYILLFIFWLLNIIDILIPDFLQGIQLLIYLASSGIFLSILYKVIKKTGTN